MNEERVAIERDAALAPVGEEWAMMLRREAALDRSIDRKVRILLSLRKEFVAGDLPASPGDQANDAEMNEVDRVLGIDAPSGRAPTEEAVTSENERTTRECLSKQRASAENSG